MSIQNISLFLPGFLTDLMTSLSKVILVFRPVPLLEWIRNKNRVAQTSDPLGEMPWCRRCVLFTAVDRLLPFEGKNDGKTSSVATKPCGITHELESRY